MFISCIPRTSIGDLDLWHWKFELLCFESYLTLNHNVNLSAKGRTAVSVVWLFSSVGVQSDSGYVSCIRSSLIGQARCPPDTQQTTEQHWRRQICCQECLSVCPSIPPRLLILDSIRSKDSIAWLAWNKRQYRHISGSSALLAEHTWSRC
jgi:hypothetical protein